jgi:integrase
VQKWAELTSKAAPPSAVKTFPDAVAGYRRDVLPTKAPRTQQDNEKEFGWLLQFFGDPPAPLDSIEPVHIRQYMRWRVQQAKAKAQEKNDQRKKDGVPLQPIPADYGHVRANRDKALFSHVWNYARAEGLTKLANPCAGIEGFHEEGRDTAPDEELVQRVIAEGDKPLQFAMRLADITGQRPSDVLRMNEGSIAGQVLNVRQGKTGAKLRITIDGALAVLLAEIREFKRGVEQESRVRVMALLVNEQGQPLTKYMLRSRFDDARARAGVKKDLFQFRDLRAKAATEVDEASGTRAAQALLGHTTEGMTADYIRHKVGKKVSTLR